MITAATITLAKTHFVRDDPAASAIAGTVTLTGSVDDAYTVKISRQGYEAGEFTLKTEEKTLQAGQPGVALAFSYPLSSLVNEKSIYLAPCSRMRGDYAIEILVNGATIEKETFSVAPLTVAEMRSRWMKGLTLSGTGYTTTDDDILDIILHAYHQLAHGLTAYPEPVRVVTPLLVERGLVTAYDQVKDAVAYIPPPTRQQWLSIPLPTPRLLTVHQFLGYMNQEQAVSLDRSWISIQEKSGVVQLVPSNSAIVQWTFYGAAFQFFFFSTRSHVPNFWNYEITAGGRKLEPMFSEYIARSAAIELATSAAQALYPGGGTNVSLSRDGVSESRGLNPKGAYAALIAQYERMNGTKEDGTEQGLKDLRRRFVGMPVSVL